MAFGTCFRRRKLRIGIVFGLLVVHAALLARMAVIHAPTMDECGHLPAGISHWYFGTFDVYCVNPHLVRSVAAIPVILSRPRTNWSQMVQLRRPEWDLGQMLADENGTQVFWYFTIARWAGIPFSLIGGLTCYLWSRDLFGRRAGLLSLTLWTFSPGILGNASQITPDAGAAAIGVAAHYFFWLWLKDRTGMRMCLAGIVLGLALLTKSTWIILVGLWPLIWLMWECVVRANRGRTLIRSAAGMTGIVLIGVYLLNVGYGFSRSFTRLQDFRFECNTLSQVTSESPSQRENRFSDSILGEIPIPLPYDFVRGIDIQKKEFEDGKWCYLRGLYKYRGWWYFYLYALAVKLPIGTLCLCSLAGIAALRSPWNRTSAANYLALLLPAITLFVLVSSQTGFTIYFRYILPVLPFIFIWCGRVVATTMHAGHPALRWLETWLIRVALVSAVLSSLTVYPHSLSYFNAAAGGPRNGHNHLIDANIDWGQDILFLKQWAKQNPLNQPLYVDLFTFLSVDSFDVHWKEIPKENLPGWYAISVHHLHRRDGIRAEFLKREPDVMLGYSIYLYKIR